MSLEEGKRVTAHELVRVLSRWTDPDEPDGPDGIRRRRGGRLTWNGVHRCRMRVHTLDRAQTASSRQGPASRGGLHMATERKGRGRGFASMDPQKQREIASKGGRAAHVQGTAHEWSSEEARQAGRKGGAASRQRMTAD